MLPDAGLFDSIVGGLSASVGKPSKVNTGLRGYRIGTNTRDVEEGFAAAEAAAVAG
jgi:hypothetical protein